MSHAACCLAAVAAAQAAEVAEGGGAAALGVLVRVAKLEAALREERSMAAQVGLCFSMAQPNFNRLLNLFIDFD